MSNPFQDIDKAFRPLFLDVLSAQCTRNHIQYSSFISCSAFPLQDEDPFEDSDAKSNIQKMSITIQQSDWDRCPLSSIVPEIGDKIVYDGMTLKISKVYKENGDWRLEGRTV